MNGHVEIVEDLPAEFAALVRREFFSRSRETFSIALCGGSTAPPLYGQLSKQDLDWAHVTAIWGDERCVPLDHMDSSYLLARHALLDNVSPLCAVHPMNCEDGPERYEDIVRDLMPIDFVHLGMGDDGHTASLFPRSRALDVTDRLVVETGDDLHKHRRLTLTYPAINQSRLAVFTVTGENKSEMFAQVQAGEDLPAAHVNAERVLWLVTPEVAAGTTPEPRA